VADEVGTDVAVLCDRVRDGDRRALARLLTLVEDGTPDQHRRILALLHPGRRGARIVGVTGPPGVGKSSVTNALIGHLRADGRRVAVLAIDPSSPLTGGALLGDRIRMQSHHADPDVFVRSMAARGHLGGLAAAAPEAALVLDAAGFDDVLVETVGVGQSEVDVMAVADVVVVVLAPGLGDSVQAAKAGVLEIADVLVVNKADQPGSGRLESELRTMLEVGHETEPGRDPADAPRVLRTVAVRDEGIAELLAAVSARAAAPSAGTDRAVRRARRWVAELALGRLRRVLSASSGDAAALLDRLAARVAAGEIDPVAAADLLLAELPPTSGDGARGGRA
jgi:LAO/AO transport system kinase